MTDQKPITPPPELVQQWLGNYFGRIISGEPLPSEKFLATQAARWGADMELDASCKVLDKELGVELYSVGGSNFLRAARRPQPKSQAEEAIKALDSVASDLARIGEEYTSDTIRAALERLRELEKGNE